MTQVGYARVSTMEQNLDLQLQALKAAGVEKIFSDHGVSGSLSSRPQLDAALEYLREGDVLVTWKLDRIGRNTRNVLALLDDLKLRGVGFRSLTESLDTTGPLGQAMITIIAAFNQLERDTNIERTRAGLIAARERGKRGGRPRAMDDQKIKVARLMYESGEHTVAEVARTLGVGVATIYRCLPARKERSASVREEAV